MPIIQYKGHGHFISDSESFGVSYQTRMFPDFEVLSFDKWLSGAIYSDILRLLELPSSGMTGFGEFGWTEEMTCLHFNGFQKLRSVR